MKIIDLIPFGHENAVTYKWLQRLTGMSKRAVRDSLNRTKKEYMICNMQDGKGFFRPLESEEHLITRFYRQELHRNNEHLETLRPFQEHFYFNGIK